MSARRRYCYGVPGAAALMQQGNGALGDVQILTAKPCVTNKISVPSVTTKNLTQRSLRSSVVSVLRL
jgi:hypothetical protein